MMRVNENGYTLVELLVGVSISVVVIGVAYGLFVMAYQRDIQSANKIRLTSNLRIAMDIIGRELRGTGVVINTANVNGVDADGDGDFGEDPVNGLDDDLDGSTDEDPSDDITIVNQDSNGDSVMTSDDNRVKISLNGSRQLLREYKDSLGNVLTSTAQDLEIWSLKIDCYHYDPAESFEDANNNGQYDAGETYTDSDGDGSCDDGFERHLTTVAGDINSFEVTLVGKEGGETQTLSTIISPRNIQ